MEESDQKKKMTQSDSESGTADRDLSLYQLHSRYARLAGLSMEELSRLWHDMKGMYPTRESHMAALFSQLPLSLTSTTEGTEPETRMEQVAAEGEEYFEEVKKRTRNRVLASCRLELDELTCQGCGFSPPRELGGGLPLKGTVVEVHHRNPVADGERETTLQDLVTLCPTCHRLLHAIGRTLGTNLLGLDLLQAYGDTWKSSTEAKDKP
jgi:predicted HNH restriction endonuclease